MGVERRGRGISNVRRGSPLPAAVEEANAAWRWSWLSRLGRSLVQLLLELSVLGRVFLIERKTRRVYQKARKMTNGWGKKSWETSKAPNYSACGPWGRVALKKMQVNKRFWHNELVLSDLYWKRTVSQSWVRRRKLLHPWTVASTREVAGLSGRFRKQPRLLPWRLW